MTRSRFRFLCLFAIAIAAFSFPSFAFAVPQKSISDPCANSSATSIESPPELVSRNGQLHVALRMRNFLDSAGQLHYCYLDEHGHRSPTLRVKPGDLLLLDLKNELSLHSSNEHAHTTGTPTCASFMMTSDATNLHFHGLSSSPNCPGDDSLHISIPPSRHFLYRVRIPKDQPPGLYWYHPHPHGHSEEQVLGGASGALIVEGIDAANPLVAGLPERLLVIRDQKLNSVVAGDTNHDPSRPAKDLSVNFIPVPYPEYPVATITTKPLTRELWRVLNASADTYVNLGVLFNGEWQRAGLVAKNGKWQQLGLVALDGVPISVPNSPLGTALWKTEILIPPGGRAEFVLQTPPEGTKAELITTGADTNPPEDEDNEKPAADGSAAAMADTDDFTPPRPLARIVASNSAIEPPAPAKKAIVPGTSRFQTLASVSPIRQRKLYFSEKVMDPKHPETSTIFYLTEDGHTPKAFDPSSLTPDIVVDQGDVEDWTIENRSMESHAFHIHQSHFLLLERDDEPASDSYLLDTVDVPYWDGVSSRFPNVKLRMDFRRPEIVGIFPYHCHILQHVDGGMMGLIEVQPRLDSKKRPKSGAPRN